ncbi:hypothetical protein ALC57_05510 [Trachymyrmex cornetzi]|uniref:Uncharacterized protein n=1 Tax=Trachymyrmex cornetzi TaxID=471704 RepID=A0A151JAV7_9HYME|nr:hypothetical protein ALC57_05510 [Trachymyrmex cornetzi]
MSKVENAPIFGDNLTAVEAISAKLAEVTRLAEKLDARLCEAGAKTRPMSIPAVVTSSASSLLSISATSPSNKSMHTTSNTTTSSMTASAVSVIAEMQPITSETVATKIKSDVIKSITPTMEKFNDSLFHIRPQSMENIEISNKDFNSKEFIENSRCESAIGEYNVEGYTTATECSTTPPPRSRSESFVTSPECEDLSIIAPVVTYSGSTWYLYEEKSNKIIKEVTETTILRVLHDIRLGVASYKVVSNTVQDHRQYIDVKDIQSVEDVLEAESREKTDDIHHHLDLSSFKESKNYTGKSSKKVQSDQNIATKIREQVLNESTCSNLREYEDIPLSSQNFLLHEDSEIKISSMKKDDNLEGEDFLEKTRKVSLQV